MASTSIIKIKKEALEHNVNFVRSTFPQDTRISVVIKGNAYGHGADVIIPALEELGINHFSVFSSSEAYDACKAKKASSTLLIMGFIYDEDFEWIIKNKIEFSISNIHDLNIAIKTAERLHKKAIIHIDIETGMNRIGLSLQDLNKAAKIINNNKDRLIIKGVASHFAGAESIANHTRIIKQYAIFQRRIKTLNKKGVFPEIKHISSSAAAINYPKLKSDMIRTGILIYGYWPSKETLIHYVHRRKEKSDPLQRAIVWISTVAQIRNIEEGEFIGYGLSFQAIQKMKIMIVPVGYANGYSRSLSNNSYVLVKGQRSPVIGSVNMNMIICDVSDIPNVKQKDEVVLIGKQGEDEISFSSFAEMNNSLNYEILARLPENIERTII